MEAFIITFNLEGMTDEDFKAMGEEAGPAFAAVPGLLAKIWITDPESNTYGGIKLFRDSESLDTYLESDLFKSVAGNPSFVNGKTQRYTVIDELTVQTQPSITVVQPVAA